MEISSVQQPQNSLQTMAGAQLMEQGASQKLDLHPQERKIRPQPEQPLKCPRCESTNTKFCYYNNYSLSQPRYFCKGCRRYWTQGGSLRKVPVGGSCRKNKRSSSSSSSNAKKQPQQHDHQASPALFASNCVLPCLPPLTYDPSDLTLAPFLLGSNPNANPNPSSGTAGSGLLDIFRSGFLDSPNPTGFNNLCSSYGFNNSGTGFLPLDSTATTTTIETLGGALDGGHNDNNGSTVGMDSARDYWSGSAGGSFSWQGLINSSLM